MYCIKCGVELADTEPRCPLCGTAVYHPELVREAGERLYPAGRTPDLQVRPKTALVVVTTLLFLLPMFITLLCDLRLSGRVSWSGYVIGALVVFYTAAVLPLWFRRPEPVVFVPCGFAAAVCYLLYIDLAAGNGWFLPFAFPVAGGIGLIVTAVVTLLRYLRRGRLYIIGGALLAMAAFMPVVELLAVRTFDLRSFLAWSVYPAAALGLLGAMLIFLAICRPARETMERKFFL